MNSICGKCITQNFKLSFTDITCLRCVYGWCIRSIEGRLEKHNLCVRESSVHAINCSSTCTIYEDRSISRCCNWYLKIESYVCCIRSRCRYIIPCATFIICSLNLKCSDHADIHTSIKVCILSFVCRSRSRRYRFIKGCIMWKTIFCSRSPNSSSLGNIYEDRIMSEHKKKY